MRHQISSGINLRHTRQTRLWVPPLTVPSYLAVLPCPASHLPPEEQIHMLKGPSAPSYPLTPLTPLCPLCPSLTAGEWPWPWRCPWLVAQAGGSRGEKDMIMDHKQQHNSHTTHTWKTVHTQLDTWAAPASVLDRCQDLQTHTHSHSHSLCSGCLPSPPRLVVLCRQAIVPAFQCVPSQVWRSLCYPGFWLAQRGYLGLGQCPLHVTCWWHKRRGMRGKGNADCPGRRPEEEHGQWEAPEEGIRVHWWVLGLIFIHTDVQIVSASYSIILALVVIILNGPLVVTFHCGSHGLTLAHSDSTGVLLVNSITDHC